MLGAFSGLVPLGAALAAIYLLARSSFADRPRRDRLFLLAGAGILGALGAARVLTTWPGGRDWEPPADLSLLLSGLVLAGWVAALRTDRGSGLQDPLQEGATDALTRVASHRAFQDRLVHECDRAYRFGDTFALLLLDIDQFSLVNNRYRHKTGDRILLELATRLRTMIREIDLCARFGGDQFAVILPHTYQKGALDVAERIRQSIGAWTFLTPETTEVRLTASLGMALYPGDGTAAPELVKAAQRALAFAKTLGGNQVQLYQELPPLGEGRDNVVALPHSGHGTIVRSLAAAVDVRDRYTHSHSRLVSELAAATARRLGLKGPEVARIKIGALLHDVGKIGVPDAVLSKEGSLTPEEWDTIRQHPVLGKTIIEQAPELKEVVPLVLYHQERFDGSGYPARMAGEDIPLGARIIAAADAYHAIRSDRPYRPGRAHADALQELRRCSGSQFDPRVVSALTTVLESDGALRSLLEDLERQDDSQPYTGRRPMSAL